MIEKKMPEKELPMKSLLVVDDNKSIRDLLSLAFTGVLSGYTVRTAQHGAEAIEILKTLPVDVIVTDLSMPVMDGYRLVEWVRAASLRMPIIVMTGEPCPDILGKLESLGVARCLEKPFNLYDAAEAVASVLSPGDSVLSLLPAAV